MSDFIDPQEVALRTVLEDLAHLVISPSRLTIFPNSQIGSGGYGEVVLAKLDKSEASPREVAVKQLRTVGTNGVRIRVALRLARELNIWAKVEHPNILGLIGYYLSENYEIAHLVSPFMAHGNVLRYIAETQPDMNKRLGFVDDITAGMNYLNNCDPPICHGDLKPANVLIDDSIHAILCDLGLASIADEAQASSGLTTSHSLKGSTRYMSPELLMGRETKQTLASDVWAWACTVFHILTDVEPYCDAKADWVVIAAILQNKPPGDLTILSTGVLGEHINEPRTPLSEHLGACWSFEPAERPSITDSLRLIELHRRAEPSSTDSGNGVISIWFRELLRTSSSMRGELWSASVFIGRDSTPTSNNPWSFIKAVGPGGWCDIPLSDIIANEYVILEVQEMEERVKTNYHGRHRYRYHLGRATIPARGFVPRSQLQQVQESVSFTLVEGNRERAKLVCEVQFIPRPSN